MDVVSAVPGVVIDGAHLSEPIELFSVSQIGSNVHFAGLGVRTGTVHRSVHAITNLAALRVSSSSSVVDSHSQRLTRTSLPMPPKGEDSFWYVHNAANVVIVFVHGIFSSS